MNNSNIKQEYIVESNRSCHNSYHSSWYSFWLCVAVFLVIGMWRLPVLAAEKKVVTKKQPVSNKQSVSKKLPASKKQPDTFKKQNAVITRIKGKSVQVSLDNSKTWKNAAKGMRLPVSSLIRTGFASSCEISFAGKSILQVQSLSSVRIADFAGTAGTKNKQKVKVKANLQYGAIKCGVEKGRVNNNTKITTPVATLSIRGTVVEVKYYPGLRHCLLAVDEGGPAYARCLRPVLSDNYKPAAAQSNTKSAQPVIPSYMSDPNAITTVYCLDEGMRTNERLSRYLRLVNFERYVWVTGDHVVGDISDTEAMAEIPFDGTIEPLTGHFQNDNPQSRYSQEVPISEIDFPGGDIPIGGGTSQTDTQ